MNFVHFCGKRLVTIIFYYNTKKTNLLKILSMKRKKKLKRYFEAQYSILYFPDSPNSFIFNPNNNRLNCDKIKPKPKLKICSVA